MTPSFYSRAAEGPRADILADYRLFLHDRNGAFDGDDQTFSKREAWLRGADRWTARYRGEIDEAFFNAQYARFRMQPDVTEPLLALLAFVKANASEAYGVEVISRARRPDELEEVRWLEETLSREESYHTRILVGAAKHFGLPPPQGAWRPTISLRVLIRAIAHAPKALYHPIVLGAEIGGVFAFNWMLQRVGRIFTDEPEVRESLERRLIEVLIDEVGHVAYNRMVVGPAGLAVAKLVSSMMLRNVPAGMPEFVRLGWNSRLLREFDAFDWHSLPEEVRRRSFFA